MYLSIVSSVPQLGSVVFAQRLFSSFKHWLVAIKRIYWWRAIYSSCDTTSKTGNCCKRLSLFHIVREHQLPKITHQNHWMYSTFCALRFVFCLFSSENQPDLHSSTCRTSWPAPKCASLSTFSTVCCRTFASCKSKTSAPCAVQDKYWEQI